ncbi:hypothetical protein Dimus_037170, partial [Dionaea muscipula]
TWLAGCGEDSSSSSSGRLREAWPWWKEEIIGVSEYENSPNEAADDIPQATTEVTSRRRGLSRAAVAVAPGWRRRGPERSSARTRASDGVGVNDESRAAIGDDPGRRWRGQPREI